MVKTTKTPAPNGRFRAMAAATPQKRQCDFAGFAPARSSVEAATAAKPLLRYRQFADSTVEF